MSDYERITLPNGSEVEFRPGNHAYHVVKEDGSAGKRLANVSTVVKPLDTGADGLMDWAVGLAYEGVVQLDNIPDDPKNLGTILGEQGLDWRSIREAKANVGTDVHERFLHALAKGDPVPNLADFPEVVRGYGQGVLRWWHDRQPEVLQAEQVVLSVDHGVAGRFDLRAKLQGYEGTCLVDAKTSKWIGAPYHAQLAGYSYLAEESGFGPTDHLLILQLLPDGTYKEIPACATAEDFICSLLTYRVSGQIRNAASRQKRLEERAAA